MAMARWGPGHPGCRLAMAGARLGLSCLVVLGFDAEVDWLYLLGRHLGLRAKKTRLNSLPSGLLLPTTAQTRPASHVLHP